MPKGIAASPGISIGKAYIFQQYPLSIDTEKIPQREIPAQLERLGHGIEQSKVQLQIIRQRLMVTLGPEKARIMDAHTMILDDEVFIHEIKTLIETERITAAHAVDRAAKALLAAFDSFEDEYTRERAADIRDVVGRMINNILGIPIKSLSDMGTGAILIAQELMPSDTAQLDKKAVLALATDVGGRTSHTAIMARSLGIPAVVGLSDLSCRVSDGDVVIVDGCNGEVYINPDEALLTKYRAMQRQHLHYHTQLRTLKDLPAQTSDRKRRVELFSNIGTPADVESAKENGAEGIGLFRTEFLYMNRSSLPSEEEQFKAYRAVAEDMAPMPVIIRTLDIGGDKNLPYLELPWEENPFLGCRAIRMCLGHPVVFKTQLRAILRASHYGNIRMMYPMISDVKEIFQANAILEQAKRELYVQNISFDAKLEVGIMVETPAAAVLADRLAQYVDFFSIGTNDLIQYTMAADRMNEKVSYLYEPLHPAVLRLIRNVIEASHQAGKRTGMCGEMAGDKSAAAILLGLGLDEFSMNASSICSIKRIIRSIAFEDAQIMARKALDLETPQEIRELAAKLVH